MKGILKRLRGSEANDQKGNQQEDLQRNLQENPQPSMQGNPQETLQRILQGNQQSSAHGQHTLQGSLLGTQRTEGQSPEEVSWDEDSFSDASSWESEPEDAEEAQEKDGYYQNVAAISNCQEGSLTFVESRSNRSRDELRFIFQESDSNPSTRCYNHQSTSNPLLIAIRSVADSCGTSSNLYCSQAVGSTTQRVRVDCSCSNLNRSLLRAVQSRDADSARLLLAAGADPNYGSRQLHLVAGANDPNYAARHPHFSTNPNCATRPQDFAPTIHPPPDRFSLATDPENADCNLAPRPLLHVAASGAGVGARRCVPLLVAAGANVGARDDSGQTALHVAAASRRRRNVLLLLAAAPALREVVDNRGRTPFALARDWRTRQMLKTKRRS